MKAPLKWLNEYVEISDISTEDLKNKLFSCGFEVEEVIEVNKNVNKIVVCQILEIAQHPNADKLSVCQIDAGKYGKLQIVTNAKNIKVGDKVPVSLDGAILADGTKIKPANLRGVPSAGMFCGGEEIGITEEYYDGASFDGVLVFHDDFPLGEEVVDLLGVKDTVFDISVTSNRPDCQSILGIARELSAVLNRPLKMPATDYVASAQTTSEKIAVEVRDKDLCPRYMAHFVDNIRLKPSPKWMQKRLALCGIRAINNIVDITNYILLEIGQPMHAFDYNLLDSHKIVVRRAKDGEKITTLDEKEFTLDSDVLVICDSDKPVALAGIMGGLNSGINDNTTQLVFECAKFKRDNIRKSSRRLGKRSDSSARYEKGVDIYTTQLGLNRALNLIYTLDAGDVAKGDIDILSESADKKVIKTAISKINGLLGIEVPADKILEILKGLDFGCVLNGDELTVTVPEYREDIEDYPDFAEEVIRIYGYDHINCTLFNHAQITLGGFNERQLKDEKTKEYLCDNGFNEIITYSFVSDKESEIFDLTDEESKKSIKLVNPLGEDMSVMRTTLMPSLVYTIQRNLNKKNLDGRLFELAKTYRPKTLPLEELPEEKLYLSLGVFGEDEDFFTLKGVIEGLFDILHVNSRVDYVRSERKYLHPTRGADIMVDGTCIGYIGQLSPIIAKKIDLDKKVYVAELNYDKLITYASGKTFFKAIAKYPSVERDLALVMDEEITNAEVIDAIKARANKSLVSVELFDVYRGEGIEEGKKSMAYRLTFTALDRTLSVEEVDGYVGKILNNLKQIGVQLR